MTFKFETFAYADVSSAHLRTQDRELLGRLNPRSATNDPLHAVNLLPIGTSGEAGAEPDTWFVALGTAFDEEDKAYLLKVGFSAEFAEIIWQLAQQQIFYVRFDAEGYEIEGAPRFE